MTPVEYIYYLGYTLRKMQGLSARKRLEGRVVSIGNLTLGGTGKTPVVIAVAEEAVKREFKTCILTRGYKGGARGTAIVSKGSGPLIPWSEAGDEAILMAERLKDVWVVKDPNRYRGGVIAGRRDIFLLDDGFQHWRLHRDIDILVIDATNPFGRNERLLPLGRLREPVEEMKRADIIIINKTALREYELEKTIRRYNKVAPFFYTYYRVDGLIATDKQTLPADILRERKVFAFSGIGNPGGFLNTLSDLKAVITGSVSFRDHHCYSDGDLKKIMKHAREVASEFIVTTEKDMVKLRELPSIAESGNIFALKISLEVNSRELYDNIFEGLRP